MLAAMGVRAGDPVAFAALGGEPCFVTAARTLAAVAADLQARCVLVTDSDPAVVRAALAAGGVAGVDVIAANAAGDDAVKIVGEVASGLSADSAEAVADLSGGVVLADAACLGTTADDYAAVLAAAGAGSAVGVRPVTDTLKICTDGPDGPSITGSLDRDSVAAIASPLVLSPADAARVAAALGPACLLPPLATLCATLATRPKLITFT